MTHYCLEHEPAGAGGRRLHRIACHEVDLSTLLGEGRITKVGDFEDATQALRAARQLHAGAVRCRQCCPSATDALSVAVLRRYSSAAHPRPL